MPSMLATRMLSMHGWNARAETPKPEICAELPARVAEVHPEAGSVSQRDTQFDVVASAVIPLCALKLCALDTPRVALPGTLLWMARAVTPACGISSTCKRTNASMTVQYGS